MDAIGAHHYWGFSPALDLQQVHRTVMGPGGGAAGDAAPAPPGRDADTSPLNILLLQPGDPRSVLKTIVQRSRHSERPLHFFLFEKPCEALARDLLLLAIAVDWELPLRQRAATWLEVFGNTCVQGRTAKYIATKRLSLVDLLCNGRGPVPLGAVVDTDSLLKFRERDELELIFHSWDEGAGTFDMEALRDHRLRHTYGERYDYRTNLVDWDYQSVVKKEAGMVHWVQYKDWRNTGRAYEYGDVVYDQPNRTLASYVEGKERGRGSVARRGFWGDTAVGPFHAVGTAAYVPTDEEAKGAVLAEEVLAGSARSAGGGKRPPVGNFAHQLFEIMSRRTGSEQHRHHAVETATYNLLSWLFEVETGRAYVMRLQHDIYSGLADALQASGAGGGAEEGEEEGGATPAPAPALAPGSTEGAGDAPPPAAAAVDTAAAPGKPPTPPAASGSLTAEEHAGIQAAARAAAVSRARSIARAFRNVRITVLTGDFKELVARGKLAPFGGMHVVCAGGRAVHHLADPNLKALLHPSGAVIVAETARNVVNLKAEQRDEFLRRVLGMAGRLGCALVGSDRQVSADTFACGTVIDLNAKSKEGAKAAQAAAEVAGKDKDFPGLPPSASRFAFTTRREGSFHGMEPHTGALPTVGEADGAEAAVANSRGVPCRAKRLGMAAYSHKPGPLPVVAAIRQVTAAVAAAAAGVNGSSAAPAPSSSAAASASASIDCTRLSLHLVNALRSHITGAAAHDPDGGDNPRPEALVFAYVPGAVAEEVAAAFSGTSSVLGVGTTGEGGLVAAVGGGTAAASGAVQEGDAHSGSNAAAGGGEE